MPELLELWVTIALYLAPLWVLPLLVGIAVGWMLRGRPHR